MMCQGVDLPLFPANFEDSPSLREKVGVFKDRTQAGELLADKLLEYADRYGRMIVVAIPSGGVPVGYTIAKRLHIDLDVMLVRKIPIPWEPEAGFGSIAFDGSVFLNDELIGSLHLSEAAIAGSIEVAKRGLEDRTKKFTAARKSGLLKGVKGKSVILVDDGLASGYTMIASVECIKKRKPSDIIVAVPTGSLSAIDLVAPKVDRLLCLNARSGSSFAVADAYEEWCDVQEEEALRQIALG